MLSPSVEEVGWVEARVSGKHRPLLELNVMQNSSRATGKPGPARARLARLAGLLVSFLCLGAVGCAALTNPVAEGVPVSRLSPEILGPSRDDEVTIPLTLLGRKQLDV